MKTNENPVHRGEVLKKAAEESGLSVEQIVERMHYASRTTFYNHTRKPSLSLSILKQYGKVLNYNFYDDIPEMKVYPAHDNSIGMYITPPKNIQEAIQQRDFYYQQYIMKLEEFRKLQEELYEIKLKMGRQL